MKSGNKILKGIDAKESPWRYKKRYQAHHGLKLRWHEDMVARSDEVATMDNKWITRADDGGNWYTKHKARFVTMYCMGLRGNTCVKFGDGH